MRLFSPIAGEMTLAPPAPHAPGRCASSPHGEHVPRRARLRMAGGGGRYAHRPCRPVRRVRGDTRPPRRSAVAIAWNLFGLLDLLVAPTAALLSGSQILATYPLAIVDLFAGPPLGIITHIYSLRNLVAQERVARPGSPWTFCTWRHRHHA